MLLFFDAEEEHTKTYIKKEHSTYSIIVLFIVGVVVPAVGRVIEHIHTNLIIAFIMEGEWKVST
jgi:hypothetical protein